MARSFNGTTQYIARSSAVVTAFPITLAWTVYLSSTTGRAVGPSLFRSIVGTWFDLVAVEYVGSGIASGYGWRAIAVQQGYSTAAERKAGSDAGATGWYRVSASFPSYGTAPTLYVDGSAISGTSSTGSGGSLTLGYTSISSYTFSGIAGYGGGRAAECAVYNVEWTAGEHVAYGAGITPPQIRPASLVAYWPLGGHHGNHDADHWKNRYDLTAGNSPTWTDHPRVIYPRRRSFAIHAPASTFTASVAATMGGMSASASASHTPPTYTASVAAQAAPMSASVAASHTPPTYTAAIGATTAPMTSSVAASHTAPTFTAAVSGSAPPMTAAVSAAHLAPTYTASVAASAAPMTASASASHATPTYTATVVVSAAPMSAAVAASHVAPVYTAGVTGQAGAMTAAVSATFAMPTFTGAVSATTGAMTAIVSAAHVVPTYTAAISATLGALIGQAISMEPYPTEVDSCRVFRGASGSSFAATASRSAFSAGSGSTFAAAAVASSYRGGSGSRFSGKECCR